MSARTWTLPNGVKVRVDGGARIELQMPGDDVWTMVANGREAAEALTVALMVEVKPRLGGVSQ